MVVKTPLGCANVIVVVVYISFERINRKCPMLMYIRKWGFEWGAMQQLNGDGKGWGKRGGM